MAWFNECEPFAEDASAWVKRSNHQNTNQINEDSSSEASCDANIYTRVEAIPTRVEIIATILYMELVLAWIP